MRDMQRANAERVDRITVPVSDEEKKRIEAVARYRGAASAAALLRMLGIEAAVGLEHERVARR